MSDVEQYTEAMRRRRAEELAVLRYQNESFRARLAGAPAAGAAPTHRHRPGSVAAMIADLLPEWDRTQPIGTLRELALARYPHCAGVIRRAFHSAVQLLRRTGELPPP